MKKETSNIDVEKLRPIKSVKELQGVLLGIAKVFHQICVEENIPYYMVGGTMLGSIRHGGFIPWDDDMDFAVSRKDFERLLKILPERLPAPYRMLTRKDTASVTGFLKISDERTLHVYRWTDGQERDYGVDIDIFQLDPATSKTRGRIKDFILKMRGYRVLSAKNRSLSKKILAYLIKTVFFFVSRDMIYNFIERHLVEKKGDLIANTYGGTAKAETMPREYMGEPRLYKFEDTQFYGVAMPEEYLTSLYGDWKTLPPEDKRHDHIVSMYWRDEE
ncbi:MULTISPECIES: LicD family protein [unclassified Fibrobacter]|jgi:lipopolysaccharide cholinephosphotransferase|uniref:LicD family protein n=1 Tax=unclassified Fibrobacter TaxID=2634177 RepID=UPI0025BECB1B|nr:MULTISPECIES: LicD family protein [unclassified Fibrobacter]